MIWRSRLKSVRRFAIDLLLWLLELIMSSAALTLVAFAGAVLGAVVSAAMTDRGGIRSSRTAWLLFGWMGLSFVASAVAVTVDRIRQVPQDIVREIEARNLEAKLDALTDEVRALTEQLHSERSRRWWKRR